MRISGLLALLGCLPAVAVAQPAERPRPPPEVAKTVEAVLGTWPGTMTATVPGSEPESFPWTIACERTALGAGAACTQAGEASIGKMADGCVLAYAAEDRAVHFMCVSSMGAAHDHRGQWQDARTIAFEPFAGQSQGQPMTETITWSFPEPDRMEKSTVVELADGAVMRFDYVGTRK